MATITDTIASQLRHDIETGALKPGARLPSEDELMARYGSSRGPVRAAVTRLVFGNLVETRAGAGTFVRSHPYLVFEADAAERNPATGHPGKPVDSWSRQMSSLGYEPGETREVHLVHADEQMAALLSVAVGGLLVARLRVRSLDGTRVALADSYYPEWITRNTRLADPEDIIPGAFAELERIGFGWRYHKDRLRVRQLTLTEAARLGTIPDAAIAFHHVRTSYTGEHKPVRVQASVLLGSFHELRYTVDEHVIYTVKDQP